VGSLVLTIVAFRAQPWGFAVSLPPALRSLRGAL
jgi:hypothetical protein